MFQATIVSYSVEKDTDAPSTNDSTTTTTANLGDKGTFVAYHIQCKHRDTGVEFTVLKRYNDFHKLQKSLLKNASSAAQKSMASFPPKMMFGNKKEEKIEKRKFNLQVWLDSVLTNDELHEHPEVLQFFHMNTNIVNTTTTTTSTTTTSTSNTTNEPSSNDNSGGDASLPAPRTIVVTGRKMNSDGNGSSIGSGGGSGGSGRDFVKALFTYKKNDESEIGFEKNDTILVIQKDTSGWWYGRVYDEALETGGSAHSDDLNDRNGFFPMNFVTPIVPPASANKTSTVATATTSTPAKVTPLTATAATAATTTSDKSSSGGSATSENKVNQRKVLYDYEADPSSLNTNMKELTVKAEQMVTVLQSGPENNGWCYVQLASNKEEGWVPEDYLSAE